MWEIAMFTDEDGRQDVSAWLNSLSPEKWASVIAALETHLKELGPAVVSEDMGRDHGDGLLEFVVYQTEGRLRIFFCVFGDLIVLLGGMEDDSLLGDPEVPPRILEDVRDRLRTLTLWVERKELGRRRRD